MRVVQGYKESSTGERIQAGSIWESISSDPSLALLPQPVLFNVCGPTVLSSVCFLCCARILINS